MQYTDKLTKGFLTGNGRVGSGFYGSGARWDIEDPTYLGFYWHIVPNTVHDPLNYDLDYMPQGLFLREDHPDSAIDYLKRTGEYYRANMLREFADGFKTLLHTQPWAFDKVSGLAEVSKIEPGVNFRAKDKKLIFEGNETLSMRLTYLLDLYRKAAFDSEYMRWKLPETQRYFSMRLVVAEIRTLGNGYGGLNEPATFIDFIFDQCEFTAIEDGFEHIGDLANYPGEAARVKIGVKIGHIRESNHYGLFGALLADTFQPYMTGKAFASAAFNELTKAVDPTGEAIALAGPLLQAFRSPNGAADFTYGDELRRENERYLKENAQIKPDDTFKWSEVGQDILRNILVPDTGLGNANLSQAPNNESQSPLGKDEQPTAGKTINRGDLTTQKSQQQSFVGTLVRNFIQTEINAAKLGNVYGLSLANLSAQLAAAAQDPLYAAQQLIAKLTANPKPGALGNIGISSTQQNLLQVFAGQLASAKAEYSAASASATPSQILLGTPGSEALAKAMDPVGNPGTEFLAKAIDPSGNPGKQFSPPTPSGNLVNPLDKLLLGGGSNVVGNPGKEILSGSPSSLNGSLGTEPLFKPIISGGDTKEVLKGANSTLTGNPGSEDLTGGGQSPASLSNADLVGPESTLDKGLEKEILEGYQQSANNPGSEQLKAPQTSKDSLGSEKLIEPNIASEKPGTEELKGPKIPTTKLGNIGLK